MVSHKREWPLRKPKSETCMTFPGREGAKQCSHGERCGYQTVNRSCYATRRNSEPGIEREPIKVCKQRNNKCKPVFSGSKIRLGGNSSLC